MFGIKKVSLFSGVSGFLSTVFGVSHGRPGGPATLEESLDVSVVFAAARVIAEGVAQMPLRLIEEDKSGNTRVAREHPAHRLLTKKPNSWMTPFEFIEGMVFSAVLGRAAIAIKNVVRGEVRELIPVPPGAWEIEQTQDNDIRYRITHANGKVEYFSQSQVFMFRGVSLDGISAIPAFSKARKAIGITQSLESQQAQLAENGGRPSGVLAFKGKLSEATHTSLRETWQTLFGPGGKGGVAILDQDASYNPMTLSLVDSQYIESRRFLVEDIARVFRVQPIMLGQADKAATYASAEQMFRAHVIHSLMPWAKRIEAALNRDILGNADGLSFDFDEMDMMRGDQKSQAEYLTRALGSGGGAGWMSVNEARREVGLNPISEEWAKTPSRGAMDPGAAAETDPEKKV